MLMSDFTASVNAYGFTVFYHKQPVFGRRTIPESYIGAMKPHYNANRLAAHAIIQDACDGVMSPMMAEAIKRIVQDEKEEKAHVQQQSVLG